MLQGQVKWGSGENAEKQNVRLVWWERRARCVKERENQAECVLAGQKEQIVMTTLPWWQQVCSTGILLMTDCDKDEVVCAGERG